MRIHLAAHFAAELDPSLLRMVDAVDDVQHRAFSGAVGADDGADLVLSNIAADPRKGFHAAKRERDPLQLENDVADAALRSHWRRETLGRLAYFARGKRLCFRDREIRRDRARAPILEFHQRLDVLNGLPAVKRVDQRSVLLRHEPSPDLAGAGELLVVGIELIVQDEEPPDLRIEERLLIR